MPVRDGVAAAIGPAFGQKMPDYWYSGIAETDDQAAFLRDLG